MKASIQESFLVQYTTNLLDFQNLITCNYLIIYENYTNILKLKMVNKN